MSASQPACADRRRRLAALLHDTHGSTSVEYVIVLALVSLGAALAVIALGPRLFEHFLLQRSILLSPIP